MNAKGMKRNQRLAVLAIVGLAVVVLSALAVAILGDTGVGALLGVLVVLAALGLLQQSRYARRFAAVSRALDTVAKKVAVQSESTLPALSKEVTVLSRTVTQWSKDVRQAEIETGIAALNRYVALGSDDATHQA
jgi:hypothetical protein